MFNKEPIVSVNAELLLSTGLVRLIDVQVGGFHFQSAAVGQPVHQQIDKNEDSYR